MKSVQWKKQRAFSDNKQELGTLNATNLTNYNDQEKGLTLEASSLKPVFSKAISYFFAKMYYFS